MGWTPIGRPSLSITMTAISSIAAVVTVPLYLGLAIDFFDADLDDEPIDPTGDAWSLESGPVAIEECPYGHSQEQNPRNVKGSVVG